VLADQGYDGRKADVWSAGVILYVLLAGFLPFDESTMAALFRKIQNADYSYPSWFSAEVRALIDQILVADPARRLTLAEVKRDPWFLAGGYEEQAPPTPTPMEESVGDELDDPIQPTQEQVESAVQAAEEMATDSRQGGAGPKHLNAFELVNQCGGFAVDRMFRTQSEKQTKRVYQFTSNTPPDELLDGIASALAEMGCETRKFPETYKVKATLLTRKGMIGVIVQLYFLLDDLQLVEVRRGKVRTEAWKNLCCD
jgi:serine/threonine protein kinase